MQQENVLLRYKLHHVLFWALVVGTWYFLRVDDYTSRSLAFNITLIKVADLALLIYITNYLLIPRLLYKKKYLLFTLVFLGMIILSSILKMNILGRMQNNPALYNWLDNPKARIYDNMIPHFFLVTAGAAVKLMLDYGTLQKRMAETAKEKAEAELNFLKSQINPHFIFNSLNAVYFLIDKNNSEARQSLHKFSEMLRYQLYEVKDAKIPIEKEIHYLEDYVGLQQLRKDEKYTVEFRCDPSVRGFSIEPLLLIPFVENAFKHISHFTGKANYVRVNLAKENGVFHFSVANSKEEQAHTTEAPGGIGLVNVKRRLELLYPGKHDLQIHSAGNEFSVNLNLELS